MIDLKNLCTILSAYFLSLFSSSFCEEIPIHYQLMDATAFHQEVVGNTIIGITRQSHTLYMLYFLADGTCQLWKNHQIYFGSWWSEKDRCNEDTIRAFWPHYTSTEPNSLFSPKNGRYGTPTKLKYYFNSQCKAFLVVGKKFQTPVILAPGCAFPKLS